MRLYPATSRGWIRPTTARSFKCFCPAGACACRAGPNPVSRSQESIVGRVAPSKEISMRSHLLPRLLLVCFLFAFGVASAAADHAAAAGANSWSETKSGENEYVESCKGFAITTSYSSDLDYNVVENHSGDPVVQKVNVKFVGALANSVSGTSLSYSGKFTRTSDYHIGRVTVSDLELRIGLPTPGDYAVKIARQEMDLGTNPKDVLHAFAQQQLESGICVLLGR